MTLGQNIKIKRQELDLCQFELAERVGVTQTHISDIERGKRNPSVELLIKIAKAFKCDVNYLTEEVSAWENKQMISLLQISFMS